MSQSLALADSGRRAFVQAPRRTRASCRLVPSRVLFCVVGRFDVEMCSYRFVSTCAPGAAIQLSNIMVRLKTRYLIVEAAAPAPQTRKLVLEREEIASLIKDSISRSYGDYGVGTLQYAFQVLYFNPSTRLIAIRCAREQSKLVETSLVFITQSQAQEVRFRIIRCCGCARTCREHLIKLTLERVEKLKLDENDNECAAKFIGEIAQIDSQ